MIQHEPHQLNMIEAGPSRYPIEENPKKKRKNPSRKIQAKNQTMNDKTSILKSYQITPSKRINFLD